mgnify:CR=1 FL=1
MNTIGTRETNFDLLRIISAFAVIAIHVNATYLQENIASCVWGGVYDQFG